MKVAFRQNLGSIDAAKFGLNHKECQIGMEAEVSKEAGEALLASGIAVPAAKADEDKLIVSWREEQAKQDAAKTTVKAVAKPAEITAPAKHEKHDK